MAGDLPIGTTPPRGLPSADHIRWPLVACREIFELRYGKALVAAKRREGKVPVFGTNGQCGSHNEALFRGPGVILGRKGQGPLGVEWSSTDYWVIDTAYSLATLRQDVDLRYAYFLIKFIGLNHLKDGTSNPTLSRETFGAQALPLPPLQDQSAIAGILSKLDDKIKLNGRMSETLEEMARALFKSWFVDFDPVRAKAGERPVNLPRQVAECFSSRLVESELGLIPEDWAVVSLGGLCRRISMGPFGSDIKTDNFLEMGVPVVRGSNLTNGFVDEGFVFVSEEKADELRNANAFPGDIVITHRGTLGQVGLIPQISRFPRYVVSQSQMLLSTDLEVMSPLFAFEFLRSPNGQHALLASTSQTGVPAISRPTTSLKAIRLTLPPREVMHIFTEKAQGLAGRIQSLASESRTLAAIRDALLPKLISGELRVKHAERFIGAAA